MHLQRTNNSTIAWLMIFMILGIHQAAHAMGGYGYNPYGRFGGGFGDFYEQQWDPAASWGENFARFTLKRVADGTGRTLCDTVVQQSGPVISSVSRASMKLIFGPWILLVHAVDTLLHGAKGFHFDDIVLWQNLIDTIVQTHIVQAAQGARAIRNHLLHDMQQSQQPQQGKSTKPFGIELALRQLRFVRLQVKLSLAFYNGKQRSYLATIVDSIVARDTAHIAFVSEQVIANIEDLILLLEKIESANDVARAQEDIKRSSDSLKELLAYLGYLVNKDAASDLQRSGLRLINNRIGQRPGMRTTAPGVMGSYGAGLGA